MWVYVLAEKMYLMSIKPKYAYRIFSGVKKFELRRWIGLAVESGSTVFVYASGKVRALIGEFRVGRVFYGTPSRVWGYVQSFSASGVYSEDRVYISGSKKALAIEVLEPRLYRYPIKLDELRLVLPDFNPPLSFREVDPNEPLYRLVIRRLRIA